ASPLQTTSSGAQEARSLQGDHPRAPSRLSRPLGGPAAGGDPGFGLYGRLLSTSRLRTPGEAKAARGGASPLRDASGPPGPGGLCRVSLPLGQEACAPGRARLLAPALGALLREAGHAHPVLWARGGLCLLRRRARRAPLRPDEGRHHPRRPAERRPAGRERRILAFCRALGLSAPGLSPLSGPD